MRLRLLSGVVVVFASSVLLAQSPLTVSANVTNSPGPINYPYRVDRPLMELFIQVSNPNAFAANDVVVQDAFTDGIGAAPFGPKGGGNPSHNCGTNAVIADGNGFFVRLTAIPANGTCTIYIPIIANLPGTYTEVIPAGAASGANVPANTEPASVTLSAEAEPLVTTKFFDPASRPVKVGDVVRMSIEVVNFNNNTASNIAFTDVYPEGLVNAANPNLSFRCFGAAASAPAGQNFVTLSGGSATFSGFHTPGRCSVEVDVTPTAGGTIENILAGDDVSATMLHNTGSQIPVAVTGTTGTLEVQDSPRVQVSQELDPETIQEGDSSRLIITLTNVSTVTTGGLRFSDDYAPLQNAAAPDAQTTCGVGVVAPAGGSSVALGARRRWRRTVPARSRCR